MALGLEGMLSLSLPQAPILFRKEIAMEDVTLKYDVEYYDYLDGLRRSGVTNMWGAGAYLMEEFSIENKVFAGEIVTDWMDSYGARLEQGVTGD